MVNVSEIEEHMEVVGSDGQHVGTVDKLALKLTKSDSADGVHHILPLSTVESIEGNKLVLNIPAAEAAQEQKPLP